MPNNWWTKKLTTSPPHDTTRDLNTPYGLGANRSQAAQHYITQQYPDSPLATPEAPPVSSDGSIDATTAMSTWQGRDGMAEAARTGAHTCPRCGSFRFMARTVGSVTTANGVVAPAPECFECGYPKDQGQLALPSSVITAGNARQAAPPSKEVAATWR